MNYWLFKSEPSDYSFENFISDKETCWEGIRNYQARNFIRDNIMMRSYFIIQIYLNLILLDLQKLFVKHIQIITPGTKNINIMI